MTTAEQKELRDQEREEAAVCLGALAVLAIIADVQDKDDIMREVKRGMNSIKKP